MKSGCLWGILGIGLITSTPGLAGPHWSQLPMSNGQAAAVFDLTTRKLTAFYEHPYRFPKQGAESADLCYDTYGGIAVDGKGMWLTDVPFNPGEGYVWGTGIVRTHQWVSEFTIETSWFSPMTAQGRLLVNTIRVTHTGTTPRQVSLFTLHNYHVGKGSPIPKNEQERIVWNNIGYVETAQDSPRVVAYVPVGGADVHGASPHNPYPLIGSGQLISVDDTGVTNDAVCGFQKNLGVMVPADSVVFGVITALSGDGLTGDELIDQINTWIAGRTAEQLVTDEESEWTTWQNKAAVPQSGNELLYRQSLATLRMAQVREPNTESIRPFGQILASLPPGQWAISWPRDAAYAISALAASGYHEEARAALEFMFTAQSGGYTSYLNGVPYLISVCRYYGYGIEESDGDPNKEGPNIELDDFGLFLWALGQYLKYSGDIGYFAEHFPAVRDLVAGALVKLIDADLNIVVKDSSIWERHWNGNEQHFTYSTLTAIRGLCDAAHWSDEIGETTAATGFRDAARTLRMGMLTQLVDQNGALVGNLEETASGLYADAAVVEAINLGVLVGEWSTAQQTIQLIDKRLQLPSGGYKRNDDGDWYDEQEWIYIDLRVKKARVKLGLPPAIAADTVLSKTVVNHGLFAELYTETGAYAGAVPMVGYGAGVYVLDLLENEPTDVLHSCLAETEPLPVEPDLGDLAAPDAGTGGSDTTSFPVDTVISDLIGQQDSTNGHNDVIDEPAVDVAGQPEVDLATPAPNVDGVNDAGTGVMEVGTGTADVVAKPNPADSSSDGCKLTTGDRTPPLGWVSLLLMGIMAFVKKYGRRFYRRPV
ncbi:MAG: hypothetical protein HUU55_10045 [Myxococcales bacterium]|nr:hypothetical protein [Myxococcales bacterium]